MSVSDILFGGGILLWSLRRSFSNSILNCLSSSASMLDIEALRLSDLNNNIIIIISDKWHIPQVPQDIVTGGNSPQNLGFCFRFFIGERWRRLTKLRKMLHNALHTKFCFTELFHY